MPISLLSCKVYCAYTPSNGAMALLNTISVFRILSLGLSLCLCRSLSPPLSFCLSLCAEKSRQTACPKPVQNMCRALIRNSNNSLSFLCLHRFTVSSVYSASSWQLMFAELIHRQCLTMNKLTVALSGNHRSLTN